MPKIYDIMTDGRLDLKNAIYKHGGTKRIAESLGRTSVLTIPERLRASNNYLTRELHSYLVPDDEGKYVERDARAFVQGIQDKPSNHCIVLPSALLCTQFD